MSENKAMSELEELQMWLLSVGNHLGALAVQSARNDTEALCADNDRLRAENDALRAALNHIQRLPTGNEGTGPLIAQAALILNRASGD